MAAPTPREARPSKYGDTVTSTGIRCPACDERLRAHPHPSAPNVLVPCGHSICNECTTAVLQTATPACPVCELVILATEPNIALGGLADCDNAPRGVVVEGPPLEHACLLTHLPSSPCVEGDPTVQVTRPAPAHGGGGPWCLAHPGNLVDAWCITDSSVICSACTAGDGGHSGHDVCPLDPPGSGVVSLLQAQAADLVGRCLGSAGNFLGSLADLEATTTALTLNKDRAIAEVKQTMEELVGVLMKCQEGAIGAITRSFDERLKALQRQAEALAVSSDQLKYTARACSAAMTGEEVPAYVLARACQDGTRTAALCASVSTVPCVRPELEARVSREIFMAVPDMVTLVVDNSEVVARQAREALEAEAATWFTDSTTLGVLPADISSRFATTLATEWLPAGKRVGPRLFCGIVDDLSPAGFHGACDNKGPTLILIRLRDDSYQRPEVFGAYVDASWMTPSAPSLGAVRGVAGNCEVTRHGNYVVTVPSPDAFMFSVASPYVAGNLMKYCASTAGEQCIRCHANSGPMVGYGFGNDWGLAVFDCTRWDTKFRWNPSGEHEGAEREIIVLDMEVYAVV